MKHRKSVRLLAKRLCQKRGQKYATPDLEATAFRSARITVYPPWIVDPRLPFQQARAIYFAEWYWMPHAPTAYG